jgi:hypothetical protein
MTDNNRIAELEAKAAVLNAEIAALKAGKPAPQQQQPRDEVRIIELNTERSSDGMPSLDQMRRLFDIVRHRVPEQKSHDPDRPFRGFLAAYRYVANCGRIAAPNSKLGLGYWMDDLKQWLHQRDAMTLDVTGSSFIAAVLASGDISFVPHDSMRGFVWEFGIVPPNHGGKPASDAWKRVLEGSVLAPSAPARGSRHRLKCEFTADSLLWAARFYSNWARRFEQNGGSTATLSGGAGKV